MSSREVAEIVGLSQSKMKRVKKKHFENIVIPRIGKSRALITWEKRFALRLVTAGGLNLAIEAIRELKSAIGVDVCVETMRNALRKTNLGLAKKVSKPALIAKNVKERLDFVQMHKDWTVHDWEKVAF
jgi:transposase